MEQNTEYLIVQLPNLPPIKIWEFEDAPEEYQAMTKHGGDEDYVALLPKEYEGVYHPILDAIRADGGSWFSVCGSDKYKLDSGDTLLISAHA